MKRDMTLITLPDFLASVPPRTRQDEDEYRRGYCDGYIAAVNAVFDFWFLGKNRLHGLLFDFWHTGQLWQWKRRETKSYFPPEFVVLCHYCGEQAKHMDHVLPRSQGGSDDDDNRVPACARCNIAKNDRTPDEWRRRAKMFRHRGQKT